MNVLMICPQFRPAVGGYERAAERLAGALARHGIGVTVITEMRSRDWPVEEQVSGFTIRRLACIFRPGLHGLSAAFAYASWLLRHGRTFDVWHVHQYGLPATIAVLCGRMVQRPVILKLTNSDQQGISQSLAVERLAALHRWAHRRVDRCIAISAETAREAEAFGIPTGRIKRIGNGVDTETFRPATSDERSRLRQELGLAALPMAVCVGRLAAEKNIDGLLEAWAMALPHFVTPWTLVIVGDGPMRAALEAEALALGVSDSVIFVGFSTRVQDYLRAADLNVLASHNEGLSNSMLEAIACGLPAVTTAVSGMRELIGNNRAGLVVPTGDSAALAAAFVELHADVGKRQRMGQRGREAVLDEYAVDRVMQRHLAMYYDLLIQ